MDEALREDSATAQIPLIAVTGRRMELAEVRRLGFVALIVKPCEPDALLAEIRRVAPPSAPSVPSATAEPGS